MYIPRYVHILEPDDRLTAPYSFFTKSSKVLRFTNIRQALEELQDNGLPDLFVVSTSMQMMEMVNLLESYRTACQKRLVPLLLVINLADPISRVPGTTSSERPGWLPQFHPDSNSSLPWKDFPSSSIILRNTPSAKRVSKLPIGLILEDFLASGFINHLVTQGQ